MMEGRLPIIAVVLGLLLSPLAAEAQGAKVPSVGVLSPGNPPPGDPIRQREAFEGGLRDLGWIPATNVVIEYRYAEGKAERLTELAAGPAGSGRHRGARRWINPGGAAGDSHDPDRH